MRQRTFGRMGWKVGEVGYGTWGMGEWSGSDDAESLASLELAVSKGVDFFDTAQSYGGGRSERLLAPLLARHRGSVFIATKVPPMNGEWPARPGVPLREVFPGAFVRESVDISSANLGVEAIDLLQLHQWDDDWLAGGELAETVADLKAKGATTERPGVSSEFFAMLYAVLLGEERGPRFGSFVALYGVEETRALIAKALKGELVVA